jgi:glyceraldehyde-3-phosphate dehydrogenase (NADP+)
MRAADLLERHAAEYARTIAAEGSKTIREAAREPIRSANILRLSAEEGRRLAGETLPFDTRAGSENRVGFYFRVPVGVVAAITPFNDPLAIAAHKAGPALAGGNAVVLKPASLTPLSAVRLAQHLKEAGLPEGRLSIVTGRGSAIGDALVTDRRVGAVTFTGGVATGEHITRVAGVRKLTMELGSNSPVIVNGDADLARAVPAVAAGAFAQAGQNCLGVQRVFILDGVYERFRDAFVAHARALKAGSSLDEATDVCAMITEAQARRVEEWIEEARAAGARVLAGGRREGAVVWPTVLEDVPRGVRVDCDEVYGPVVSLYRATSLDEAIDRANDVEYGLHAAIFTESLRDAFAAVRRLHVSAVIVNDSTDYRLDTMPFGGTKKSGMGREGIRFAMLEMTETRVACFNL